MSDESPQRSKYPTRVAERLFSLRRSGIVDASWIKGRIAAEARNRIAEERRRLGKVEKGALKRVLSALKGVFSRSPSVEEEADAFADALLDLMKDDRVTTPEGFIRRYFEIADSPAKMSAVLRALRRSWLDGIDLPLDALEDHGFQDLLAASVYRFAYGREGSVHFVSELRAQESEGVYLTYLKDTGSGLIERRLLAYRLIGSDLGRTLAIRAVELSRENGKLIVRSGVMVPNQGHDAFALSGAVDMEECRAWLQEWAGSDDPLFDLPQSAQSADKSFLPIHRLGFLTLRQRSPSEVVGAFVDGERFGQLTGRKLDDGQLDAGLIKTIGRLGPDEVGALPIDDRNLIAAMPRFADPQRKAGEDVIRDQTITPE